MKKADEVRETQRDTETESSGSDGGGVTGCKETDTEREGKELTTLSEKLRPLFVFIPVSCGHHSLLGTMGL